MYIDFPDGALGALVASRAALESACGEHAVKVMVCVTLLMRCRSFVDLMRFACLLVVPVALVGGNRGIEVSHDGVGLRIQPLDNQGDVIRQWVAVEDLDVERVAVVALTGVPVLTRSTGPR